MGNLFLDDYIGPSYVTVAGGAQLTRRSTINFIIGATAVDNPVTGTTDVSVTGGNTTNAGELVVPVTSASQSIVSPNDNFTLYQFTGGTGTAATITWPSPANAAATRARVVWNNTPNDLTHTTGAGNSFLVAAGLSILLRFGPEGVSNAITGTSGV